MALTASFTGKKVLVTGGGKGLGRCLIQRLSEDGAIVFTLDKDQSLVDDLKRELPQVTAVCVDLLDWAATRKAIESFGPLDHLVNNAGILIVEKLLDLTEGTVDKMLGVNFKAAIHVTQAVAKGMIDGNKEGTIVNISSLASRCSVVGMSMYCSTKAAIVMLTKSMALELGPHNIRVNCICPTGADTDMLRQLPPEAAAALGRAIIKRPATPNEVADLILFLLSPLSAMIVGEDVLLDGGVSTN